MIHNDTDAAPRRDVGPTRVMRFRSPVISKRLICLTAFWGAGQSLASISRREANDAERSSSATGLFMMSS